ncbi:hypothetical protein PR048_016413 [Dryococelus australis]|uniref:Uncharacterized protein n=1 Tax=Dryococelus australis TaxID=614101 RepID=A0ABQ9HK71_9NEOP|nr:hypothetical protein PR048_016413 [Dryococelus australis]
MHLDISAKPTYICNGTRDISGEERLSVCFGWVDKDLCKYESFVDVIISLQLPISNLRGQTYDGAPDICGKSYGVQAMLSNHQTLALYVHCGSDCINLVIRDACNSSITFGLGSRVVSIVVRVVTCQKHLVHLSELRAGWPVGTLQKSTGCIMTNGIVNQVYEIIEPYEEILATLEGLKIQDKAAGLLREFEAGSTILGVGTKQTTSGLIDAVILIHSNLNNSRNEDDFKKIFE